MGYTNPFESPREIRSRQKRERAQRDAARELADHRSSLGTDFGEPWLPEKWEATGKDQNLAYDRAKRASTHDEREAIDVYGQRTDQAQLYYGNQTNSAINQFLNGMRTARRDFREGAASNLDDFYGSTDRARNLYERGMIGSEADYMRLMQGNRVDYTRGMEEAITADQRGLSNAQSAMNQREAAMGRQGAAMASRAGSGFGGGAQAAAMQAALSGNQLRNEMFADYAAREADLRSQLATGRSDITSEMATGRAGIQSDRYGNLADMDMLSASEGAGLRERAGQFGAKLDAGMNRDLADLRTSRAEGLSSMGMEAAQGMSDLRKHFSDQRGNIDMEKLNAEMQRALAAGDWQHAERLWRLQEEADITKLEAQAIAAGGG